MGMRPPHALNFNQFDEFSLYRNRKIHRERIREPSGLTGAQVDKSRPTSFHKNAPCRAADYVRKQEELTDKYRADQVLISKIQAIQTHGARSTGGPPPLAPRSGSKTHRAGGRESLLRAEQQKIHVENRAMLRRITNADPQYSTNKLAMEERQRVQYLANCGRGKKTFGSKFVSSLHAHVSGAMTDREHYSHDYDGIDPTRIALAKVDEDQMAAIVNNKKPPGCVRNIFTALMLLVSPFDTSEADVQWTAVQEWVTQMGGVTNWLHNLWNFNIGLVPVGNATKCKKFIIDVGLEHDQVKRYSECLANFLSWLEEVCASAQEVQDMKNSGQGYLTTGASDSPGSQVRIPRPPNSENQDRPPTRDSTVRADNSRGGSRPIRTASAPKQGGATDEFTTRQNDENYASYRKEIFGSPSIASKDSNQRGGNQHEEESENEEYEDDHDDYEEEFEEASP